VSEDEHVEALQRRASLGGLLFGVCFIILAGAGVFAFFSLLPVVSSSCVNFAEPA
jgi:hypothetical protein